MKTTKIIAAAAVALFAAAGAQAETYEGVHALTHSRTRAEVSAEATVAARAGDQYNDGAFAGNGVTQVASAADRSVVRAQAVAAAHDPLQNLDRKAFVNSTVPAQYTNGSLALRQQQRRQASL